LHSRIGNLLLNFPEMPDVRVDNKLFEKISLVRRTAHYSKALQIARLLLLNYHPDIQSGRNSVLALLFDMNVVWEKFIFKTLQRKLDHSEYSVKEQVAMDFWKPRQGNSVRIKPDIVLKNEGKTYVIDTKWKTLDKAKVDMADLRQMFVYHKYFEAPLVAILYPGSSNNLINGSYSEPGLSEKPECTLMPVDIGESITIWQQVIASTVINWMKA
jgi:5-methylcytosine-specific restriction enzyme subunit McrC